GVADAPRAIGQDADRNGSRARASWRGPRCSRRARSRHATDGPRGQSVRHRGCRARDGAGHADVWWRGVRRRIWSRASVPRRPRADRDGPHQRCGVRFHRPRALRAGGLLMARPLNVGAVMYDPKVSVIWEIIRDFFDSQDSPIDVAFYSTYEQQNDALLRGEIDVAWNSPLAWLDAQRRAHGRCRAIAMRDTDRDRCSYFVARRGGPVQGVADLK